MKLDIDKVVPIRYLKRTMLQTVYGIKQFQTNLPAMARQIDEVGGHYIVTRRNKPVFVAIPFDDYKEVQDILLELNSPELHKDISQSRKEYQDGKTQDFDEFVKELK